MNPTQKLVDYLRSTKEEVRKVSWPTRQETARFSALVIGVSVLVAAFFAFLDFGFSELVNFAVTKRAAIKQETPPPVEAKPDVEVTPSTSTPVQVTPQIDLSGLKNPNEPEKK